MHVCDAAMIIGGNVRSCDAHRGKCAILRCSSGEMCDTAMLIGESQIFNDILTESSGLYTQNKIKLDGKVSFKIELITSKQEIFLLLDLLGPLRP